MNIEEFVITNDNSILEYWFAHQDHIIGLSIISTELFSEMYKEFLQKFNELYHKTGASYYYFTNGELYYIDLTNENIYNLFFNNIKSYIKIDKVKLRDSKINEILL
jgi:hypothetical protein